jgi:hypothetical protein
MSRHSRKERRRRLLIISGIVLLIAAFAWAYYGTSEDAAKRAVEDQGYLNVMFVSEVPVFLSDVTCSGGDIAVLSFRASDPKTKMEVDVTVCGSVFAIGKVTAK